MVGMVAAIKRGSAFMLVDDELPAKRIQLMGRTARPAVVSSATHPLRACTRWGFHCSTHAPNVDIHQLSGHCSDCG